MKDNVCVVGATGHLGLAVVRELCLRHYSVVAVVRSVASANLDVLQDLGTVVRVVDASKPTESYASAFSSVITVISCLSARIGREGHMDPSNDFWAIDCEANIRLGRQALEAGAGHVILVATFEGPDARYTSDFLRAKEEAVDYLQQECAQRAVVFSTIRLNAYFKDLTDRAFQDVLQYGWHTVLGHGHCHINPISREDVSRFLVDCVQDHRVGDFRLGGPDTYQFRDIGAVVAAVIGKEDTPKIVEVSLFRLRLLASILNLIGWVWRPTRSKAALLRWMVYVSTHDAVAPCHGTEHLRDEFMKKYKKLQEMN